MERRKEGRGRNMERRKEGRGETFIWMRWNSVNVNARSSGTLHPVVEGGGDPCREPNLWVLYSRCVCGGGEGEGGRNGLEGKNKWRKKKQNKNAMGVMGRVAHDDFFSRSLILNFISVFFACGLMVFEKFELFNGCVIHV